MGDSEKNNSRTADTTAKQQKPAHGAKRFFKLAGLTTGVAARYAGNALANVTRNEAQKKAKQDQLYVDMGEQVANTLGELKGAAMKLGQLASQAAEFLPEEFAGALTKLQNDAPPMDFAVIDAQIKAELGAVSAELFAEFDREPYAAASIGQVHRAVTHAGQQVVVKVQYPNIAKSVDSDLRQLKLAMKAGRLVKVKGAVLNEMFAEVKARLLEELDYLQEAKNLALAEAFHADNEKIIIPRCLPEYTTAGVLTMEYIAGDHIDVVNHSAAYTPEIRNEIGRQLFQAIGQQIFALRAVHSDPHPGNFAYRPNGAIVMYDFGCMKHISVAVAEAYHQVITAALAADYGELDKGLLALGIRVPTGPMLEDRFYDLWRSIFLKPMLTDEAFDFAQSTLHKETMKYIGVAMKYMDSLQPTAETIFIDRVIGGHYWTLIKLRVNMPMRAELLKLLDVDIK